MQCNSLLCFGIPGSRLYRYAPWLFCRLLVFALDSFWSEKERAGVRSCHVLDIRKSIGQM